MTKKTETASTSAEVQETSVPGSVGESNPFATSTAMPAAVNIAISPNNEAAASSNSSCPRTAAEVASLLTAAVEAVQEYVLATNSYVATLRDDVHAPASLAIRIAHFRRQGLSVIERFEDFIQSAGNMVAFLADRSTDHSGEFLQVAPIAKNQNNDRGLSRKLGTLSPQEKNVLGLLIKGLPNKHISYELGIAVTTAKAHVGAIFRKLKVSNRARVIALLANVDSVANAGASKNTKRSPSKQH
jgi:ATP/maltotriose-dependent transcriptional regulator MalT